MKSTLVLLYNCVVSLSSIFESLAESQPLGAQELLDLGNLGSDIRLLRHLVVL